MGQDAFYYTGGVYEEVWSSNEWVEAFQGVNHCITVVGYDDTGGYWILKNSWGAGWGEGGYFSVPYGNVIENYMWIMSGAIGPEAEEICKTLTLSNEGDADLIVNDITVDYQSGEPTGWLKANQKSFTVSPGGSKAVNVCVDCTGLSADGNHGWLNIHSNDPDENPYLVTVTLYASTPTSTSTSTSTPTPTPTPTSTPALTCPDLVITDIWNESSKIGYTIKNIGGAAASRSYTSLEIEGRFKSRDDVKSLAPGESSTESFWYRWRCTSLDDEIKVCADHVKRIAECNEGNNCRTETLSC
jgi:hypothetical protein